MPATPAAQLRGPLRSAAAPPAAQQPRSLRSYPTRHARYAAAPPAAK